MAENIGEQYEATWSEPIEALEDAEKMFSEGEEPDEAAEKETIRDTDFSINDIKDAIGEGNLHNGTSPVTVQLQYGTPNQENNVHLRFYITPVPFCGGATQRYRRNQKNNVHLP